MICGTCGGFYNQACVNWPQCHPAEPELPPLEWGFRIFVSMILSAIFTMLILIWWKI